MKRSLCLILCLSMLCLWGCSGKRKQRPAESVPKGTSVPSAQTEPSEAQTEATAQTEPASEVPAIRHRIQGSYRGVQEDGSELFVDIRSMESGLLLEFYLIEEGIPMDFWAEEFWPEENGLESHGNTLCGQSQFFSLQYTPDTYWGRAEPRQMELTKNGVILSREAEILMLTREALPARHHSLPEELGEVLGNGTGQEQLPGTWSYYDGERAVLLQIFGDGTMTYGYKTPEIPVVWLTGVWITGEKAGELQCLTERIGYGKMPFSFTLYLQNGELTHNCKDTLYLPNGTYPLKEGSAAWQEAAFLAAGAVG